MLTTATWRETTSARFWVGLPQKVTAFEFFRPLNSAKFCAFRLWKERRR
jgi:hypothetical protein